MAWSPAVAMKHLEYGLIIYQIKPDHGHDDGTKVTTSQYGGRTATGINNDFPTGSK